MFINEALNQNFSQAYYHHLCWDAMKISMDEITDEAKVYNIPHVE